MYATGLAAPQILVDRDPEAAEAVRQEILRQQNSLVLIASENHASQAVLEASASVMTNKYAEGYPGRRYYAGCEFVDVAESLAIERVNRLFGSEHANVQSHSGTQAKPRRLHRPHAARRDPHGHAPRPRRPPLPRQPRQLHRQVLQDRLLRRSPRHGADRLRAGGVSSPRSTAPSSSSPATAPTPAPSIGLASAPSPTRSAPSSS